MTGKEFYKWYHGIFLHDLRDHCMNDTEFMMKVEQCRTLFTLDSSNPSYDAWKCALEGWLRNNCPYIIDYINWDEDNETAVYTVLNNLNEV